MCALYKMFILETLNNFFTYYNYNTVVSQINSTTTINSYIPLCSVFSVLFYVKTTCLNVFTFIELLLDIQINSNMKDAICMAIKFLLCIALLIFARGGIPRFRFDYLTKLGWIRFLSLVLLSFLVEILILAMF